MYVLANSPRDAMVKFARKFEDMFARPKGRTLCMRKSLNKVVPAKTEAVIILSRFLGSCSPRVASKCLAMLWRKTAPTTLTISSPRKMSLMYPLMCFLFLFLTGRFNSGILVYFPQLSGKD